MNQIALAIVVAAAKNGVIGVNNTLPWRLPRDLAHFKEITMNKPIIMGRNTFDSIGRPLPGRLNIIVTRQADWERDGVVVVHSLERAIETARNAAREAGADEVMLIGGADLYAQALPLAQRLYFTEVDCEIEGDAFFPKPVPTHWQEVSRVKHSKDDKNPYNFAFVTFRRA